MTCMNYPECGCPDDLDCIETPRRGCLPLIFWTIVGWAVIAGIAWYFLTSTARAHDAIPTAAQPEGWKYPFSCCSGIDCRPVGKKHKIKITERPEGYVIGTTGEVIAYGDSRLKDSPDGEFHWCSVAGADDSRTICLFAPPRGF